MNWVKKYIRDINGGIATPFVIGTMASLTVMAAGLDYTQSQQARRYLQDLTDNAALAVANEFEITTGEKEVYAHDFVSEIFGVNYDLVILDVTLVENEETITVNTTAVIKPTIRLMRDTVAIQVSSEVNRTSRGGPVEISFVFDTTASMKFGSKWEDVTDALSGMVEGLEKGAGKDDFRVSLVPFSDRVNIGNKRFAWTDESFLQSASELSWYRGCVEPREEMIGSNANTLTNKTHSELKFVPSTSSTYGPAGWYRWGGIPYCSNSAIVYPTSDVDDVEHALEHLTAGGTGRFDVGLAWGYRMLSNSWRADIGGGVWPDEDEVTKVAVFLTDGYSIAYEREVGPVVSQRPWGRNKGTPEGFENVLSVCDQMKDEGIEIHMIGVSPHANAEDYFRQCASGPEYYHDVSSAEDIIDAIGEIGVTIDAPRIAR